MLPYDYYAGTLSPEETIKILKYLMDLHGEEIYGGRRTGGSLQTVPFEELVRELEMHQHAWSPLRLP